MKNYKVSLSFQCDENWNKMTPTDNGRHCGSCNKLVVDFSSMTDTQIVNYLFQNKNTCGKFNPTQLDRNYTLYPAKKKTYWPAVAAMLVTGMFSLATPYLNAATNNNTHVHGGVAEWVVENPLLSYKRVDPAKIGKIQFTVRLFAEDTREKIKYGSITITGIGTFEANADGDIIIYFNGNEVSDVLEVSVNSSYGHHYYKFMRKDLKNSAHADLYLPEMIMPAGIVSIEEK